MRAFAPGELTSEEFEKTQEVIARVVAEGPPSAGVWLWLRGRGGYRIALVLEPRDDRFRRDLLWIEADEHIFYGNVDRDVVYTRHAPHFAFDGAPAMVAGDVRGGESGFSHVRLPPFAK